MSRRSPKLHQSPGLAGRRKVLIRIGLAVSALALATVGAVGWLAYSANQIQANLHASLSSISELRTALVNGDTKAAQLSFHTIQVHIGAAHDAATDPVWKGAAFLPVVGANFSVITEVAVSANDVVERAMGPLVNEYHSSDWATLAPVEGRLDLGPIERVAPRLSTAASTVQLSYDRLHDIDRSNLIGQVTAALDEATGALDSVRGPLNNASTAAILLPSMLGSESSRNYLVLVQNSAEIRATGGIPGALAVVSASEGRIELTDQASASDLGHFDPAVIVDPDQALIYSTRMGRFMQSANLTPDFPTAAQTAATMWETHHKDTTIDGVLALDPVALSHILRATGPVELKFEDPAVSELLGLSDLPTSLDADNVVPTLLSDVYAAIDEPSLQDAYFAAVAAEVFDALASGKGESDGLIQSLISSANEGRLYVWSANEKEQETIATTALAGSVTGAISGGATFGAYFNDGTGAKMDFYIRRTVQLKRSCTGNGYLQYTLTATLTNTAPLESAELLPAYVTGGGEFGVAPGTVQTNIVGYGPDQSQLQTARIDGEPVPIGSYRHGDRPVGVLTTRLLPGQSAKVEVDFTDVVQTSEPVLDVTPTIEPIGDVVLPLQADPACG